MRKIIRRLAKILAAIAALALIWAGVTMLWGEPTTAYVHHRAVAKLERQLKAEEQQQAKRPKQRRPHLPALPNGKAVGRLAGHNVNAIVVMGNSSGDLKKGPGLWNYRPGFGKTTVISGHRTTYGAPFRDIDDLHKGDRLKLSTPYGTWRYNVTHTRIVKPTALWVTRNVGHEQLVLTACHPVYSAKQRIIVFADRI